MIPLFTQDGLIICFEALPEEVDARDHFIQEWGWTEEQFTSIEYLPFFCAMVSAWKDGIEQAVAYLGCCCYEKVSDFYTKYKDDYFKDMVNEVIENAKTH